VLPALAQGTRAGGTDSLSCDAKLLSRFSRPRANPIAFRRSQLVAIRESLPHLEPVRCCVCRSNRPTPRTAGGNGCMRGRAKALQGTGSPPGKARPLQHHGCAGRRRPRFPGSGEPRNKGRPAPSSRRRNAFFVPLSGGLGSSCLRRTQEPWKTGSLEGTCRHIILSPGASRIQR
jgi:hypothetical protein